jgi:imidazolonepropionase-like amidohydrolase
VELDADGTLLPGLIDAHVHLCLNEDLDVIGSMDLDDEALLARMRAAADKTLAAGVTTVRDLGDRSFLALEIGGPLTVLASGPPLTSRGGHCWFWGGEVETVEDMLRAVELRAKKGCAVVKVMTSGGTVTPGSSLFDTQFNARQLRIIVDEAHRLGLSTAAHRHAPEAVRNAVAAGFDTLEHLSVATEDGVDADYDGLQQLVDEQRALSATFGNLPGAPPPPAIAVRLEQARVHWVWLAERGALIVIGSDAGLLPGKPHGVLPHALRDLLHEMGGEQSLATMTSGSAEVIR